MSQLSSHSIPPMNHAASAVQPEATTNTARASFDAAGRPSSRAASACITGPNPTGALR